MRIYQDIKSLREEIFAKKKIGNSIAFVATMGALHDGHMELVKEANQCAAISVVSIFVNPTQFNEVSDLENYPRTLDSDLDLLEKNNCDIVFVPSVDEIYSEDINCTANYGILSSVLEAANRPGHFDGVVTIVKRLFEIITPDIAFFGQKDFQQLAIIRQMTKEYDLDIEIVGVPIVREKSGLAMSSRNKRLSSEEKEIAVNLSRILSWCALHRNDYLVSELKKAAIAKYSKIEEIRLEYLEFVDPETFINTEEFEVGKDVVALLTAWVGDVRLLDNIILPG